MYSSAIASSDAVVVPGRMRSRRMAWTPETTSAARRRASISSGRLTVVARRGLRPLIVSSVKESVKTTVGRHLTALSADDRARRPTAQLAALHEAVVVAHHQVRFDLAKRIESHTDDDQEARSPIE